MPTIYNLLNYLYDNTEIFQELFNRQFYTFLAGFIASLIGIATSEKYKIMNFIILSVFLRSVHSVIVVWLKKKKMPTQNKFASWFAIWLACLGVLFLNFYYPQYKPVSRLVDKYALYEGKEREEMNYLRESMKILFNY
jgi:hypothetical protein